MADSASTVTVDRLFAPAPHGLINDPLISHAAFRLWCVLHRLAFVRLPPEMDRLCEEMTQDDQVPTRRSVYRWLGELETRGWLHWQRTPGKASVNRFLVLSERKPVTQMSQDDEPVTPESQPVTPESQPVTLRSQVVQIDPLPARPKKAPLDHENHKIDGGDGRALHFLESEGIGAAKEFAHFPYEPMRLDYQNRRDAGQSTAMIVKAWRRTPPTERYYYGQQRSPTPDRPGGSPVAARGKHGPTGGAELKDPGWMDRLIAQAENGEL